MKKLVILVAIVALAAFAYSKLNGNNAEEYEFGG